MISDSAIKDLFFKLEQNEELFSFRVKNIPLYFIFRFRIECFLREDSQKINYPWLLASRLLGKVRMLVAPYVVKFRKNKPDGLKSSMHHSNLLMVSTSDWTLSPKESIELVDIIKYYKSKGQYTNFIQPDYNSNNIIKQPYHEGFYRLRTSRYYHFSKKDIKAVEGVLIYLSKYFRIDFKAHLYSYIRHLSFILYMAEQLESYITSSDAKYVFARSVYTEPWIPIACRRTGSKCIEVQHGVVGPEHIYYQSAVPVNQVADSLYFPDYVLTLGEEWTRILISQNYCYNSTNVFTIGINDSLEKKAYLPGETFRALICLQHALYKIDDVLTGFLNKYSKELKKMDVHIIIRPHPNYFQSSKKVYQKYANENVVIEDSRNVKFSESLNKSHFLISPTSMCLYEAISVGIPVASFEKFKGVTIQKEIKYIKNEEDMLNFIIGVRNNNYRQTAIMYLSPLNPKILDLFIENLN